MHLLYICVIQYIYVAVADFVAVIHVEFSKDFVKSCLNIFK